MRFATAASWTPALVAGLVLLYLALGGAAEITPWRLVLGSACQGVAIGWVTGWWWFTRRTEP